MVSLCSVAIVSVELIARELHAADNQQAYSSSAEPLGKGTRAVVETVDQQHLGQLVRLGKHSIQLHGDSFLDIPRKSVLRIKLSDRIKGRTKGTGSITLVDGSQFAYNSYDFDQDRLLVQSLDQQCHVSLPIASVVDWNRDTTTANPATGNGVVGQSTTDTIWVYGRRSPEPRAVDGVIVGLDARAVTFALDADAIDSAMQVPWERIARLRFYQAPSKGFDSPECWVESIGGDRIAADEISLNQEMTLSWESPYSTGQIAVASIAALDLSAGRIRPAADLELIDSEWQPYFSEPTDGMVSSGHRFNSAFDNGPLTLAFPDERLSGAWPGVAKAREYRKGIAMRSRGQLTFLLPPRSKRIKGILGLDPSASRVGDTEVRLIVDDRVVFSARLDGATRPIEINTPIENAQRLTLEVDYGANLDTGDRVHFADLRVIQ